MYMIVFLCIKYSIMLPFIFADINKQYYSIYNKKHSYYHNDNQRSLRNIGCTKNAINQSKN